MNPSEIKALLERYGIHPTKARGQNFLTDERVAEREVEELDAGESSSVLEVGPGLGVLTERLIGRVGRIACVELDERICHFLTDRFDGRIELIHADALEVEFPPFDRFISNLPYSISSPLLFKVLDSRFERGVVMVQKEFADRMVARAGSKDYSRLSVSTYYRARCEIIENVSRGKFWPQPEVDSSMVLLEPRDPPFRVENERFFLNLVSMLFQHRRKKIGTVLRMTGVVSKQTTHLLPDTERRVEELEPERIGKLADAISGLDGA
jgi:16S rRNA (adenine1518-N6/adenine1519-N6)-dimethyltransferase